MFSLLIRSFHQDFFEASNLEKIKNNYVLLKDFTTNIKTFEEMLNIKLPSLPNSSSLFQNWNLEKEKIKEFLEQLFEEEIFSFEYPQPSFLFWNYEVALIHTWHSTKDLIFNNFKQLTKELVNFLFDPTVFSLQ